MTTGRLAAISIAIIGLAAAGCATVALVPGAEKVKITKNASDVAACKAVGNVNSQPMGPEATNADLQNKTVELGGNTIFVTGATGRFVEGVAYSCP